MLSLTNFSLYSAILAWAVPSINNIIISIAIVVMLIARHVGVLTKNRISAKAIMITGIAVKTTVLYSFKVPSTRSISD